MWLQGVIDGFRVATVVKLLRGVKLEFRKAKDYKNDAMAMTPRVDRFNFTLTIAVLLGISLPLLFFPEGSALLLKTAYAWIGDTFGWFYILTGATALGVSLYLAFGPYAGIRLGDGPPEFSFPSWASMLFAAGIGAGLMYWSGIEWAHYAAAPPFGAEPKSPEAYQWAASYGMHHWGVVAWALYCLPTLAIAYPFYVRRVPYLKYSTAADYWLKGRQNSWVAKLMDGMFMVALIGGAGSSLGFSTPLIAALISRLTGIPESFGLEMAVVILCVAIFSTSVAMGLGRGIRRLSDLNMILALVLLVAILFAGDTLFLLRMAINSLGHMLQNTIAMTFWTDPIGRSGFVEDWTIFYWAWWVSYGPFVGLFVSRISRGRTIREVVLGMLVLGSLGCWLFYMLLGNHSLGLQVQGELDVMAVMESSGGNAAIIAGLDTLPLAGLIIGLLCFVSVIFCATTYDSASYTLATSATEQLHPSEDPPRWHRLFWAIAVAILPIALMYAGGIREAQTAVLVVSLPLVLTLWPAGYGLLKSLQVDHQNQRAAESHGEA